MKTNNKVLMLLLIVILAVSGMTSGVFAAGGDGLIKDPKPTLEITKIRPKESTEYVWEFGGGFGDWVPTNGSTYYETLMDLTATREIVKDVFSVHIEANLSLNASTKLIVELGSVLPVEQFDDDGNPIIDPDTGLQEVQDQFVSIRRFEDIEYVRPDATQEAIKFDFIWEDIDRELFDDPETDEIEGITHFKLIVPYTKSRGNTGEVSVSRQIGLEEHEAYGYAYIESDLLDVIAIAEGEGADVDCSTAVDDWYADMFSLPLGEGDVYRVQATIGTNQPTKLEMDEVLFVARPYMENNEEFHIWYDVDPMAVYSLNFPKTDSYVEPSDNAFLTDLILKDASDASTIATVQVDEGTFIYPYELEAGAALPIVEASTSDGSATYAVVQATMETRTAIVTVTAENGVDQLEYRVDFTFGGNNDATLKDLTVNGTTVEGVIVVPVEGATDGSTTLATVLFDPTVLHYHVEEDATEGSVTIGYQLTDEKATAATATVTYGTVEDPLTYFPRREEVIVTAEDQTTIITYSILFAPVGWTPEDAEPEGGNSGGNAKRGSKLTVLAVDNEVVDGFTPEVLSYDVMLDEGTRSLPQVTAVAENDEATIQHIKPTRLPGQYKLKVTANVVDPEDETAVILEESVYTLNLDVEGLAEGEFIELETPLPADMLGLWLPPTGDGFVLERTSTQLRFWTSQQLIAPKLLIFHDMPVEDLLSGEAAPLVTITTSQLKSSGGGGKHSRSTITNGDGGFYKYNLKGRNMPNLETGGSYVIALFNGDEMVYFQPEQPALLHFTVGELAKTSVSHRNRTLNLLDQSTNINCNQ